MVSSADWWNYDDIEETGFGYTVVEYDNTKFSAVLMDVPEVKVNEYSDTVEELVIPGEVEGFKVRTVCLYGHDMYNIRHITLPSTVENIIVEGTGEKLLEIDVDENNPNFCSVDGVLYTNFIDIIAEYETHETVNPKTGEKMVVKSNSLKRNEVKIRIRKEILQNKFFLTDAGYTQFYFPATRHTKTATANRLYKWLSKWRGIKKNQMEEVAEQQPDGTERTVGRIVFAADYMEVRSVCGLFNSQDGKIVNGVDVEALAIETAKDDGCQWKNLSKQEQKRYDEQARQRAAEKYAYYSEFAKRYLAQAKKELDDLSSREIADFTFDYRAIFADGRKKGKVPVKVEFTLIIFDLGRELYENKEISAKEIEARRLMKERLALTADQINGFIRRLQPGDHDHLLDKLHRLIDINMRKPADNVQNWACHSLNEFFGKELPQLRDGFAQAEEVTPSATDMRLF